MICRVFGRNRKFHEEKKINNLRHLFAGLIEYYSLCYSADIQTFYKPNLRPTCILSCFGTVAHQPCKCRISRFTKFKKRFIAKYLVPPLKTGYAPWIPPLFFNHSYATGQTGHATGVKNSQLGN